MRRSLAAALASASMVLAVGPAGAAQAADSPTGAATELLGAAAQGASDHIAEKGLKAGPVDTGPLSTRNAPKL